MECTSSLLNIDVFRLSAHVIYSDKRRRINEHSNIFKCIMQKSRANIDAIIVSEKIALIRLRIFSEYDFLWHFRYFEYK